MCSNKGIITSKKRAFNIQLLRIQIAVKNAFELTQNL